MASSLTLVFELCAGSFQTSYEHVALPCCKVCTGRTNRLASLYCELDESWALLDSAWSSLTSVPLSAILATGVAASIRMRSFLDSPCHLLSTFQCVRRWSDLHLTGQSSCLRDLSQHQRKPPEWLGSRRFIMDEIRCWKRKQGKTDN